MPIRHPVRITLLGLALGFAFDRLLVGHPIGVGFPLFVVLVLGALALSLAWEKLAPLKQNLWVFLPVLFFAAMIAVRANEFMIFLNVAAVLVLLCVIAVYLLRKPLAEVEVLGYALAPILAPVMAVLRGGQASRLAVAQGAGAWRAQPRRAWLPVVRGILLASPVVLIFALLLSSADAVFAEMLRRILPADFVTFMQRVLEHGLVVVGVGFVLLGGLAYALWREEKANESNLPGVSLSVPQMLGLTESAVVLNAVNLLFAAFVAIQVPYLFGGRLNIDLGKLTYAEYARRGFGELVFAAVLVLGLLLILGTLTRREGARGQSVFNLSSTVMVGLTVVMLVSAFKRLMLYEEAYGFTEMRVYPHVFMIWLALLLGWFLVTLWLKPGRFAVGLVVACIGFVATLNVMNVDDFVVRQNVARYERLGAAAFTTRPYEEQLDLAYLDTLSYDATPALVASVGQLDGWVKTEVQGFLKDRYDSLITGRHDRDWRAFNLSYSRAERTLALWHAAQR